MLEFLAENAVLFIIVGIFTILVVIGYMFETFILNADKISEKEERKEESPKPAPTVEELKPTVDNTPKLNNAEFLSFQTNQPIPNAYEEFKDMFKDVNVKPENPESVNHEKVDFKGQTNDDFTLKI